MTYLDRFSSKFFSRLLKPANPQGYVRDRATSLELVFELLEQKKDKNFTILETGCMRADHGQLALGDDGASTYIFDDFINFYDGEVISVDIKQENVNHAQAMVSERTTVYCDDSVSFLHNLSSKTKLDLLYLDSYDFDPENPIPSQLHHMKELCAAQKNLKKGTIVMVDDHANTPNFDWFTATAKGGKAGFVENYIKNIDAELLHDGYQIVWRV